MFVIEIVKGPVNYLDCLHNARVGFMIRNLGFFIIVANCGGHTFTHN